MDKEYLIRNGVRGYDVFRWFPCGHQNIFGPQLTVEMFVPYYNKCTKKILILRILTNMAYVEQAHSIESISLSYFSNIIMKWLQSQIKMIKIGK